MLERFWGLHKVCTRLVHSSFLGTPHTPRKSYLDPNMDHRLDGVPKKCGFPGKLYRVRVLAIMDTRSSSSCAPLCIMVPLSIIVISAAFFPMTLPLHSASCLEDPCIYVRKKVISPYFCVFLNPKSSLVGVQITFTGWRIDP